MYICPRCNGTGESPLCEACACVYCGGSGELDHYDRRNVSKYQRDKQGNEERDHDIKKSESCTIR